MSRSDEFLTIDTPENVVFDYEVVGIGTRFIAALIDTLLLSAIVFAINLTLFLFTRQWIDSEAAGAWAAALFSLLNFALIWGYYIFYEIQWNGQSPGKRWAGIRVIRRDGTPITLSEAIIRNLIRVVDFLPIGYGVGLITMFIHPQSCRLGDLAAGTLVVREQAEVELASLVARPVARAGYLQPTIEAEAQQWPIERLTAREIELAVEFMQRRHSINNPNALALTIARRLFAKMELTEQPLNEHTAPAQLASIVKAYQERR